jgi:son of sevenless-like protein
LCTFDLSSITLGEKNPQFFEEFKVQLPVALQRGHHLLFVLYNIDDDEIDKTKKKKSSKKDKAIIAKERAELGTWERKIIGYAYLDLIGQVAADLKSPNEWEHVPGECVFTDVAKLIVIKNLCMHYMHANAQLDTYGNKCRIEVATMLHSTLYPADSIIHRFYWVLTEIERVHVQNQCVDEQLTNLISVLKGFRVIDYTTLLPYAPLILNTLFRLLATANAFNLEKLNINNVETALFEALLVFLRGIYLVTGKEFTRKNRTFMSYVQFIFFNCTEKIYSPLPAYVFIPKLYLSFLKDSKYNTAEFGNEDVPTVKSEKKKGLFSNKKKVVSVTKDESSEAVSERDALRFSWFFFDIIIKSLTLALKGEKKIVVQNNYDDLPGFERTGAVFEKNETIPMAHHENGWDFGKISENNEKSAKSLFETLLQVVEPFCMKVMKLMRNTKPQAHIGKHANRNMALFLRDLFPILPRIYTIQLIQKYLNTMTATDASIILLKVEFCTILMDYDHFVSVNIGSHGPVLAHQCMDVIYEILSLKRQQTAEKGISLLLAHLTKMDHDARHDDERFIHRREQLAELYIPFVGRVLSNGEMLCYFVQDKSHTDLIICMLWIMSNMSRQKLVEWWQQQDKNVIYRTCRFLELAAAALFLQPDHELCKEGVLVVKDLVALFVAPTTLKPIIGNFSLMEKPSEEEKTEERFEDEFESPFLPHPYVTLLMRYLSHMLMNLIVSSNVHATTNSITGQLFTRFYFSILETFLENYMEEVTCLFMYHGEQKLPILHQKKVETKWRWLLGVVLLNSELKSETMSKQLLKCMHLLIDPYLNDAEYLRHNKELSEADMEGDIVYDDKDGTKTIRGATLKKLIERLIQHSDIVDSEGNKFKKTFLLTYFSFTTPRDLLAQLVKLYNIKFEEGDSAAQLNSLNFIQEWVKKGFHDFDNFAIAELIQFLSTLEVNPITRTKMRKPIMKQLLGVQTQHMVTAQKEQYEPSEVPKDFDLEAMETPVMPIKKWKQLKKKMNVNPFDYPFDILQWSALEIARQMTIIESELFNAVEPKECFGLAWSKENKEDLAPNLVALSNRFQQVTLWIVNTILSERDLKKRQSVLLKWIEIMREAYALKNFASVYQISAALNSAEIGRLSKTKEAIDSKDLEFCEHTLDFSKSNYRILRNLIKESAGSATIPFIGVYLTDLTFTNDGNVDDIPHAVVPNRQLINFTKRRLYSTSIVDIQLLQQSCKFPKLRPIPYLQYILRDHINQGITWATEKERYNQSLELEPRK